MSEDTFKQIEKRLAEMAKKEGKVPQIVQGRSLDIRLLKESMKVLVEQKKVTMRRKEAISI